MPKIALGKGGAKGTLQIEAGEHRAIATVNEFCGVIADSADRVVDGDKIKPLADSADKAIKALVAALPKPKVKAAK